MDDLIFKQDAIDAIIKKLCIKDESYLLPSEKEIVDTIKEMPPANQWILCSEILPNKDGNYIVKLSYTDGFKFSFVDIDNFSVYEHQWDVYGSDVTAWMPLPKLLEGE